MSEPPKPPKPASDRKSRAVFKKGQRCLVPHTDRFYAAVILKAQKRDDGHHYEVHYDGAPSSRAPRSRSLQPAECCGVCGAAGGDGCSCPRPSPSRLSRPSGWAKKYDEWIEEAGLVKFDRKMLEESNAAADGEGGEGGEGPSHPFLAGKRRKADLAAEAAHMAEIPTQVRRGRRGAGRRQQPRRAATLVLTRLLTRPAAPPPLQLRLAIPPVLKKMLVDDHEQVVSKGTVLPLPRSAWHRPTVNQILAEYGDAVAAEAEPGAAVDPTLEEVVSGLRTYFDRALRHFLLYQAEVPICDEVRRRGGSLWGGGGAGCRPGRQEEARPGLLPCSARPPCWEPTGPRSRRPTLFPPHPTPPRRRRCRRWPRAPPPAISTAPSTSCACWSSSPPSSPSRT